MKRIYSIDYPMYLNGHSLIDSKTTAMSDHPRPVATYLCAMKSISGFGGRENWAAESEESNISGKVGSKEVLLNIIVCLSCSCIQSQ